MRPWTPSPSPSHYWLFSATILKSKMRRAAPHSIWPASIIWKSQSSCYLRLELILRRRTITAGLRSSTRLTKRRELTRLSSCALFYTPVPVRILWTKLARNRSIFCSLRTKFRAKSLSSCSKTTVTRRERMIQNSCVSAVLIVFCPN